MRFATCALFLLWGGILAPHGYAASTLSRYYAHEAVEDADGVIAPWYTGQNGQIDYRIRVSAETLKRYPWTGPGKAVKPAPHYVYTSMWSIDGDGAIGAPPLNDWMCGDLGQRTVSLINCMADYYRYSGDPSALATIAYQADYILEFALTPSGHAWPAFPVSVPVKGTPYGACDPSGYIQLDLAADIGAALLRAYQILGDTRYFEAAKHWGDLLAAHARLDQGEVTWDRYANPGQVAWSNQLAGSITMILRFLDVLERLGYPGEDGRITRARDAGRACLEDVLLPRWTAPDTWGRYYWDWECPVLSLVNVWAAQYLMDARAAFPRWRTDTRNVMTLIFNRAGVDPASACEVYHGAWAVPESPSCCGNSLSYGQQLLAAGMAQYSALTNDPWARELARRMAIQGSYDILDHGAVIDGLTGTPIVAGTWLNIIHPLAMRGMLQIMAWLPDLFGPNRENHLVRSTAEVKEITYAQGHVAFATFDAPKDTHSTLRLAFPPQRVLAGGRPLAKRDTLDANGYTVRELSNGDCLLEVRHDGAASVFVAGDDPQRLVDRSQMQFEGGWEKNHKLVALGEAAAVAFGAATLTCSFTGNQVRIIGDAGPDGGRADVVLDGVTQRAGIDAYCPVPRANQILFSRSGLAHGAHSLTVNVLAAGNPRSAGSMIALDGVQFSDASGDAGFGSGGGPVEAQRLVFGYTGREDLLDAAGNAWRPATEWVVRMGQGGDAVGAAWWTAPVTEAILGTAAPEPYRYGVHAHEFTVNVTAAPGEYVAVLKFAATRDMDTSVNRVSVVVNGSQVADRLDIAALAGGRNRAYDLRCNGLRPRNGVIEFRFRGGDAGAEAGGEAFLQALELVPASGDSRNHDDQA